LITNAGCKLEYLHPYSPDYNPIEYTFAVIKSHLKQSGRLNGTEKRDELAEKVMKIANEVITPEIARNEFYHCKISI
jgi:transposase